MNKLINSLFSPDTTDSPERQYKSLESFVQLAQLYITKRGVSRPSVLQFNFAAVVDTLRRFQRDAYGGQRLIHALDNLLPKTNGASFALRRSVEANFPNYSSHPRKTRV